MTPSDPKECPVDSKEHKYFNDVRKDMEKFLGYEFECYHVISYTDMNVLNAGTMYEVKIKIAEDKYLHARVAKKPLLKDMDPEESDDNSQEFVDEDKEYELEFVAYRENVGREDKFEWSLKDSIRYHETMDDEKAPSDGENLLEALEKEKREQEKENEGEQLDEDSDKSSDQVGVPGNPCICPKRRTDEEMELRFN